MGVVDGWVPERRTQTGLLQARVKQVTAANNVTDVLIRIIYRNSELIGYQAVSTLDDKIADVELERRGPRALDAIVDSNDDRRDTKAN